MPVSSAPEATLLICINHPFGILERTQGRDLPRGVPVPAAVARCCAAPTLPETAGHHVLNAPMQSTKGTGNEWLLTASQNR